MKNNIQENEEGHKLLQRVINLALLPHEMIETELEDIEKMVKEKIIDESKLACWDEFFKYFRSYWMSNVGPENFSVFDCYDRTNNFAESYHRHVINRKLGGRKSPKSFLGKSYSAFYKAQNIFKLFHSFRTYVPESNNEFSRNFFCNWKHEFRDDLKSDI